MIDVIIRLISFCNQAVACTKRARLEFGESRRAMGYLNRIGFLDHLANAVEVTPHRPIFFGVAMHLGGNRGRVEIERFSPGQRVEQNLLPRLVAAVTRGCPAMSDVTVIGDTMASRSENGTLM